MNKQLLDQEVIIYYGKDYLMVTQGSNELFLLEATIDAHIVGKYKRFYENLGYIIIDVINTDA